MSIDNSNAVKVAQAFAERAEGWSVETLYGHSAHLVNGDGVTIYVREETYGAKRGKVTLSTGTPDDASYTEGDTHGLDYPRITVSADRSADALARDITRRLIPAALEFWSAVSERIARRVNAKNCRETLAQELAKAMGGTASDWRNEWRAETPMTLRQNSTYTYGHMVPDYKAETVNVELHNLTPAQAHQIAALVAEWSK